MPSHEEKLAMGCMCKEIARLGLKFASCVEMRYSFARGRVEVVK
jgi:hypothetical protein